ncbi:MAG: hypothetical protein EP301_08100, partial [Gammaproteobacteria bacterium]
MKASRPGSRSSSTAASSPAAGARCTDRIPAWSWSRIEPTKLESEALVAEIPELCALSATEQRSLIESRSISSRELTQAHLDWIDRVNPQVNALCTLVPELALSQADAVDAVLAAGEPPGALAGLPAAIKDLVNTRGIRTTHGSPLLAANVPGHDALHVARMKAAGAVILGKTNTPEWGAGSQTFNPLFGATATPYDLSRTSGGSSGGAAA